MAFSFLKSGPKPVCKFTSTGSGDDVAAAWFLPQNAQALKQLFLFSVQEFSAENILCMFAVKSFQKTRDKSTLALIWSMFLDPSSPFEINVPSPVRKKLKQEIENFYAGPQGVFDHRTGVRSNALPPVDLVRSLEIALFTNIGDTLSRFSVAYMQAVPRNPTIENVMPFPPQAQASIYAQLPKYREALTTLRGMRVEVPGAFATL